MVHCAGISCAVASVGCHIKRKRGGRKSSIAQDARALMSVDVIVDWDETCANALSGLGKFWPVRAAMILCLNAEL